MKPFGFIIITYNRPDDTLALLQNIACLDAVDELLEEIILVNNNSTADYRIVENYINQHPQLPIRYHHSAENLGVARGRNFAITKSSAPILIMIDDDAELRNKDALIQLHRLYQHSKTTRPLAIVSFKVVYYSNGQMQRNAFPHKDFIKYCDEDFFETYYYAGGAHAIKREALTQVGSYPTDFFYGMEEYDLSYRLLDAGWGIVYSSAVVMLHKESPLGRKPKEEKLREMWLNKCKVAWRYLPKRFFYSTAAMWSLQYLKVVGINGGWFKGWRQVWAVPKTESRKPVSQPALNYLKQTKARLWY